MSGPVGRIRRFRIAIRHVVQSRVIRIFAVAVHIQSFPFLLFRHAQSHQAIRQFEADKCDTPRPDYRYSNTFQLYQNLMPHRDTFGKANAPQRTGGKDASQDATDYPAHAMNTKNITRIIHPQDTFKHRDPHNPASPAITPMSSAPPTPT